MFCVTLTELDNIYIDQRSYSFVVRNIHIFTIPKKQKYNKNAIYYTIQIEYQIYQTEQTDIQNFFFPVFHG